MILVDSQFEEIESFFLKEIKLAQKNINPTNNQIYNRSMKRRIELINWTLEKKRRPDSYHIEDYDTIYNQ
jgi:hypothetical protein